MKTLYRKRDKKVIAGVARGIGEYFDIDPVFIRLLFVITLFTGGIGIIAYIILWIITPLEPYEMYFNNFATSTGQATSAESAIFNDNDNSKEELVTSRTRVFGGFVLIFIGIVILLDNLLPYFDFDYVWSIVLISIGFFLIVSNFKNKVQNE
ncbi:MAG: PspC domain-containing protein [Candidatus Kapaibacteriota bacterium]